MRTPHLITALVTLALLLNGSASLAFETDQYNLPPEPLADIGDEVSEYVEANLLGALETVNEHIAQREACLGMTAGPGVKCRNDAEERAGLARLRSNDAVAYELFLRIGDGSLFITKFGKWITSHQFRAAPARFKTGYGDSIFVIAPLDYVTISPTVRLYGTEMGTDKLEHLLQQGYKYYTIMRKARAKGEPAGAAVSRAIRWGKRTERTYFGTLVSGVYSNADLYANYAGMRFYEGLTEPVRVDGAQRTPAALLKDGRWAINDALSRRDLLAPFMSDHMNEALNPSGFAFHLYPFVRRSVKRSSCTEWRDRYPAMTKAELTRRSEELELWHGEDYGFTKKSGMLSIAEICFADRP